MEHTKKEAEVFLYETTDLICGDVQKSEILQVSQSSLQALQLVRRENQILETLQTLQSLDTPQTKKKKKKSIRRVSLSTTKHWRLATNIKTCCSLSLPPTDVRTCLSGYLYLCLSTSLWIYSPRIADPRTYRCNRLRLYRPLRLALPSSFQAYEGRSPQREIFPAVTDEEVRLGFLPHVSGRHREKKSIRHV